jgi:hypothetical protein
MFSDRFGLTQAVLEGRKTMARRLVPENLVKYIKGHLPGIAVMESRYKVGEVVAVARSYAETLKDPNPRINRRRKELLRRSPGWTNKMFVLAELMTYRIRITNVRVERLQDISDEDCLREGVMAESIFDDNDYCTVPGIDGSFTNPLSAFVGLINRISGRKTWESNPWVFVYEFELVKQPMKARNKVTGEVVSNFGWSKEYGTISYIGADGLLHNYSGLATDWEVLDESETDWAAYRREAAKEAMLKMLMCDFDTDAYPDPQEICGMAVLYADELIKQLQGK